ncbi:polysaccharide deacetylase family protein [Nocardiopsis composta]|uniref:Peptidoglycan/xylan/chitin deacetylase (PgdA/CDA1 family) n=1 Tax=Nocardiopsis composta TaxID=157465 RepID=A0A7W8QKM0_9ACTN|nr:polysaccharide deacetylase family protein [Nocardiopsis composta]MBB5432005.1 peptidoglycan/xylan/chitin deacetylase (PgdA/CDA1 family) [Nocardiopsis composta]
MTLRGRALPGGRTALGAAAAAVFLLATACSPPSEGEHAGGSEEAPAEKPSGEPDELTAVDPETVADLDEEHSEEKRGDVSVEISYPVVGGAGPFADELGGITDRAAEEFADAVPGAESLTVTGALTAAGGDVLGVRLEQKEKDSDGTRTGHSTYWYDAATGATAYSTQLLAGDEELGELHERVTELLAEQDVDTAGLYPIAGMYDSIGFNPDGDLVVEFDEGQLAPAGDGRVHAVVPRKEAEPLLSDLGERARAAATAVTPDFTLEKKASAPKDGAAGEVPGRPSPASSDVDCSDPEAKCIALTFDDGPGGRTPELLDELDEYGAKATFFLTGEPIREHPETVRREYAEGHEVANHTESHPDLTTLGKGGVREELASVSGLIDRETGYRPELMRPPYGATDDTVAGVSRDLGMAEIIWSVDTNDWKDRNSSVVADRAVKGAEPGAIILMHDIHDTTVDAVPEILKRLDEKGFTMVTVSQLLGETEPGEKYFDGEEVITGKDEEDSSENGDGGKSGEE